MTDFALYTVPSVSSLALPDVIDLKDYNEPQNASLKKKFKNHLKHQIPSTCLVCNSPANCYHYDVPSCNGCKTFFRRTIISGRTFTCQNSNNCLENNGTLEKPKRMCRACRFEKCVQAGMNPLALRSEIITEEGNKLVDLISAKHRNEKEPIVSNTLKVGIDEKVCRIIEELSSLEMKTNKILTEGLPPGLRDMRTLKTILNSRIVFNNAEIPGLVTTAPKICKQSGEMKLDVKAYIHLGILAVIEYLKMFELANELDMETKIILSKQVAIKCNNMSRAFFSINTMKSDKLVHPNGQKSAVGNGCAQKLDVNGENHYDLLQKTLRSMLRNQVTRVEYLLMKAIMLWDPAINGISKQCREIISNEREKYVKSLFRYCLVQHGCLNGPARFSALLSMAPVLENQQKGQKDFQIILKANHYIKYKTLEVSDDKIISNLFEEIMGE